MATLEEQLRYEPDSDRRRMTVVTLNERGQEVVHTKGSADVLVPLCVAQETADGEAPLRAVDPSTGTERLLASLDCGPANLRARRIDPHPAWGRDGRSVVVNLCIDGRRQVAIADLSPVLPAACGVATREHVYA